MTVSNPTIAVAGLHKNGCHEASPDDVKNERALVSDRSVVQSNPLQEQRRRYKQQRRFVALGLLFFVLCIVLLVTSVVFLARDKSQKKKDENGAFAKPASTSDEIIPTHQDNETYSESTGQADEKDRTSIGTITTEQPTVIPPNSNITYPTDPAKPTATDTTPTATATIINDVTNGPTSRDTAFPTFGPTSIQPTTTRPTNEPTRVTFNPGELTVRQNGLLMSTGLSSRLLAVSGRPVNYDIPVSSTGRPQQSQQVFHSLPDMGACFIDPRNTGGWIYVSNSEVRSTGRGGVGAFTFDANSQLVDYRQILTGTTSNCGGGRTPWGAWISCEETTSGRAWQVDPTGVREPRVITLGSDGGVFESFAYDDRDRDRPTFFLTEDATDGALQRFRVDLSSSDWNDPWNILLGTGTTDFLLLDPNSMGTGGTFEWTRNRQQARRSAAYYYPNSEGIDVHDGRLYFVSKVYQEMYTLDLDAGTYTVESTVKGLFNGGPDQIKRILNHNQGTTSSQSNDLLCFTEDGGNRAGIHARNAAGAYLTILESDEYENETTGLSFSPDGKAMYIAYQNDGLLFEIRREDGLPFYGNSLNVAYHATA